MFDKSQSAYVALRNIVGEHTTPIVAWIGSGLSKPAGLPTWPELRRILHEALDSKIAALKQSDTGALKKWKAASVNAKTLWQSFEFLKNGLGPTTYRNTLRDAFSQADRAPIPLAYKLLWELDLSGILNLNIDKLATRAFNDVRPGQKLNEFSGNQTGSSVHVLKSPHPFLCNLHGVAAMEDSWVFTRTDLDSILNNPGYQTFIKGCICSRTIVFVGMSADDRAAGGHLEALTSQGVDTGASYWITNRTDRATDKWAEEAGVRIIRYSDSNHHADLIECLEDLRRYVPQESLVTPVLPSVKTENGGVPSPSELANREPEFIRNVLNNRARSILAGGTEENVHEYEAFCSEYARAIHNSWFVSTNPPDNTLFGYELVAEIDEGAFGTVYRALSSNQEVVAIKMLREGVRKNLEMLHSFRRGVKSMDILSKRRLTGTVPYREASEIPACVVMDHIEGPNLRVAVDQGLVNTWHDVLVVGTQIADILSRAHQLPERVLHRDLRPENIMLNNYWAAPEQLDVVLLDFDLSWHRDAVGKSVCNPSTVSGYLAPEQMHKDPKISTRNALVDSYGLGMTLHFLRTAHEPTPGITRNAGEWELEVRNRVAAYRCGNWCSLPARYARLICSATRFRQTERWDVAHVYAELQRIIEAEADPGAVLSGELVAEELASRSPEFNYIWNFDNNAAECHLASGVKASVSGDDVSSRISLCLGWQMTGNEEYKRVRKWIGSAMAETTAILKSGGWKNVLEDRTEGYSIRVEAQIDVEIAVKHLDSVSKSISEAISRLTFA